MFDKARAKRALHNLAQQIDIIGGPGKAAIATASLLYTAFSGENAS
jgi:hypothetical protein